MGMYYADILIAIFCDYHSMCYTIENGKYMLH
jgi:hypothetical protein